MSRVLLRILAGVAVAALVTSCTGAPATSDDVAQAELDAAGASQAGSRMGAFRDCLRDAGFDPGDDFDPGAYSDGDLPEEETSAWRRCDDETDALELLDPNAGDNTFRRAADNNVMLLTIRCLREVGWDVAPETLPDGFLAIDISRLEAEQPEGTVDPQFLADSDECGDEAVQRGQELAFDGVELRPGEDVTATEDGG